MAQLHGIEPTLPYGTGLQPTHDPYVSRHPNLEPFGGIEPHTNHPILKIGLEDRYREQRVYLSQLYRSFPTAASIMPSGVKEEGLESKAVKIAGLNPDTRAVPFSLI